MKRDAQNVLHRIRKMRGRKMRARLVDDCGV